jgi:isopenicillin N synthase-like dioxygenase
MTKNTPWNVPVVDISAYLDPARDLERPEVARQVDAAARTHGFIQIVGHGIPETTVRGLGDAIDGFFAQSLEEKKSYIRESGVNRGYIAPKSESASLSVGIESAGRMNDFFEAFKVGVEAAAFPGLDLPTDAYASNNWPVIPEHFQPAVDAYFEAALGVARALVQLFGDALDIDPSYLDALTDHSLVTLQMINYALPEGEVTLDGDLTGMGEHTDFGLVTLLWADAVPGLQVLGTDRVWHDVAPAPGALLINFGDLISRMTNDHWMSTLHRVKPPVIDGRILRRRSAAFFYDCNFDAVIDTLPAFVGASKERIYEPVTVAEHIATKLGSLSGTVNKGAAREAERVLGAMGPRS